MNNGYYNVKTAIDDIDVAKQITKSLLEKRLVSSVQQKEITSTWWWNNELEESKEYVLEMKTKKSLYKEVEREINTFIRSSRNLCRRDKRGLTWIF